MSVVQNQRGVYGGLRSLQKKEQKQKLKKLGKKNKATRKKKTPKPIAPFDAETLATAGPSLFKRLSVTVLNSFARWQLKLLNTDALEAYRVIKRWRVRQLKVRRLRELERRAGWRPSVVG